MKWIVQQKLCTKTELIESKKNVTENSQLLIYQMNNLFSKETYLLHGLLHLQLKYSL